MNGVIILACLVAFVLLLPLLILTTKDDMKASRQANAASPVPAPNRVSGEPAPPGVRCPACQSQRVVKVPLGRRVGSGIAGGLVFSKAARAQFQCQSCEYFF